MATLTINVSNIPGVLSLYSKVQIKHYTGSDTPPEILDLSYYEDLATGIDIVNSRTDVSDVNLNLTYSQYYFEDPLGTDSDYYISRYSNSDDTVYSAWSLPIQASSDGFDYNPLFPSEVQYSAADNLVIKKLRLLVGDPTDLVRLHGEEDLPNLHSDRKVFELSDKGWPYSIRLFNTQYTSYTNPSVNGYKYLRFNTSIDSSVTTISGIDTTVDVWYTTFRFSDKQLMDAYDNCLPPSPLTTTNCTQDIYLMQTAYDLLSSEAWELAVGDGAEIADTRDTYNPASGLTARDKLLARLKKQLDDAVKARRFVGMGGVRID